jgi:hypothetical protein
MSKRLFFSGFLCMATALGLASSPVQAQVYGTDYLSFQGTGIVLDNPTSAACQSIGVNYGDTYTVIYRWAATTAIVDALSIIIDAHSVTRIISTSTTGSLNGTSTVTWAYINRHADFASGVAATTTTMTISSGLNQPVSLGTGNIKIVNATINNFFGNATAACTVNNFHAALVAIPN